MKKRYKVLICFLISSVFLIMIFILTRDKKIYYISIGDFLSVGKRPYNIVSKGYSDYVYEYLSDKKKIEFYTKKFASEDARSVDVLNDLKTNKEIYQNGKKITLKHALIKADVVTISIGANDFFNKLNLLSSFDQDFDIYKYLNDAFSDIDKLLHELRLSCKEQIMVLGFYNPFVNYNPTLSNEVEPYIIYANSKMKNLTKKYDMTFVDVHDIFFANNDYLPNYYDFHPTSKGYKAISDLIISLIDKKTLAK